MQRRDFLKTSIATTAVVGLSQAAGLAAPDGGQQYYELRTYNFKPGAEHKLANDYLEQAALPALNRIGIKPVGIFTELDKPDADTLYVLIPYPSLEAFVTTATRLAADADYLKAGADYLNTPATAPAYARLESSFMAAFAGMPQLILPATTAGKQARLFELRTYESHSEQAALKKIEMFNNGEIAIMRHAGLSPVFYGQMLIGPRMPNLTYMLSGPDMATHKKHWGAFGGDAEWKKISAMPEYIDAKIVSKISNKFLTPTAYSQI